MADLVKRSAKKTITWITADYFIDCDFNADIFIGLLEHFNIHWLLLLPIRNARFSQSDFHKINQLPGLTIQYFYWTSRARSPKMLLFYQKLHARIIELNSDITYFNDVPTSPYILPLYLRFNKRNTIVTAHDGNVKPSFKIPWLSKIVFKLAFNSVRYVNMFSLSQSTIFKSAFITQEVFVFPLGLKNFGTGNLQKRKDSIGFLFFGTINSNKNLDLLIEAACNLHEKGVKGFKVAVHGFCSDWDLYKSKIKYPELFEYEIRLHSNSEIPDLFTKNHYAVFPYKEVSQSGALKVAFNYSLPVIVSDLKGFTDEVKNNINGFIFKSNDVKDLEKVMQTLLITHADRYKSYLEQIINYNKLNYSTAAMVSNYLNMFNQVLDKSVL